MYVCVPSNTVLSSSDPEVGINFILKPYDALGLAYQICFLKI
jgi:hypothetical protein